MRQRFRTQLLADAVFTKLAAKTSFSEDDEQAYYDAHLEGYRHPASREVRQISVKTRAEADRIEKQLHAGADFAQLAQRYSTDTLTASGGGLETFTKGQTLRALLAVASPLKTGAVAPPVQTQNGWHVIQAVGPLKPDSTTPFGRVKPTIESLLLQQAQQRRMKSWISDARAEFAKKTAYAPGFGPPAAAG